jgi:hypothetical protein
VGLNSAAPRFFTHIEGIPLRVPEGINIKIKKNKIFIAQPLANDLYSISLIKLKFQSINL